MNKKGFTLVEMLAVIVILGIVTTIGLMSISSSIGKSRDATVVDLAINYADSAKTMRAKGTLAYEPKNGEAVLIPYSKVDGNQIENGTVTGYGDIFPDYCYVGIVNSANNYYYYVTQVDDSYHFLNAKEYNSIKEEEIMVGSDKLAENGVKELKAPFTGFSIQYGNSIYSVKAVRAKFDATIQQTSTQKTTVFENQGISGGFSGRINILSGKVELVVKSSSNNSLSTKKYTFTTKTTGSQSSYVGQWVNNSDLLNNLVLDIKEYTENSIKFDVLIGTTAIYSNITTSNKLNLYGQFYSDNQYASGNVAISRSLSDYDGFVRTGKFTSLNSNVITYDGVKYKVENADLLYIIAKKN